MYLGTIAEVFCSIHGCKTTGFAVKCLRGSDFTGDGTLDVPPYLQNTAKHAPTVAAASLTRPAAEPFRNHLPPGESAPTPDPPLGELPPQRLRGCGRGCQQAETLRQIRKTLPVTISGTAKAVPYGETGRFCGYRQSPLSEQAISQQGLSLRVSGFQPLPNGGIAVHVGVGNELGRLHPHQEVRNRGELHTVHRPGEAVDIRHPLPV